MAAARTIFRIRTGKGTLVIVGGGSTNNTGIIEKFIELAGGPETKFVIVPTAGGAPETRRRSFATTMRKM